MIVVKIQGGLGNQMFQYAFGRARAEALKEKLLLDTSWFYKKHASQVMPREFGLSDFAIPNLAEITKPLSLATRVFAKLLRNYRTEKNALIFDPAMAKTTKQYQYFDGYWQNEGYFADIRTTLLSEFSLNTTLLNSARYKDYSEKIKKASHSVSLHVRRTDYATYSNLVSSCTIDYYTRAMKSIEDRRGRSVFFVFSDDIEWSRTNLPHGFEYVFVPTENAHPATDMLLMSLCSAHIIANSSFSWWGVWLDQKKDTIVVGPSVWDGQFPEKSPLSTGWQRI